MAREVLPVARDTPVLAGVCRTDPFRDMRRFLARLRGEGFAGVQNFPTVGLIDGVAGFFGASSTERLPVERALTDTMRRFKGLTA